MNHNRIERHIVAKGNYAMATGGEALFTCPSGSPKPGEKLFYNVLPHQLVAYQFVTGDVNIPTIVDHTSGLLDANAPLFIGVGWDSDGDGVADDVRLIAGEGIRGCNIEGLETGLPDCGSPFITAATIDCTECAETYTARVTIDDNRSRSWGPIYKTGLEFIATYKPDCNSCDDCPADLNCKEVACGIVDELNGEMDLQLKGTSYPDWKNPRLQRPYKAVVGHQNWYAYCFTPDAASCDCDTCNQIDGVKKARIDGVDVTFTGNFNPNDGTKTLLAQVKNIAFQIERGFEAQIGKNSGFTFVSQGVTPCCAMTLYVVTCDDQFELYDDTDALIATCDPGLAIPPTFTTEPTCATCGDYAQGTLTFTGNALDTETVVIDGITYTFLDTFVDADYNVHIGADAEATINNLVSAMTGVATGAAVEGTDFPTGGALLAAGSDAEYESHTTAAVTVRATISGTAGNLLATTDTLTNADWGGATMAGGTAETPDTVYAPACWIAILVDPAKPDCDCYLEKTWNWYGVNAELSFIKDANDYKPRTETLVLQRATAPRNFGQQIQWLEYKFGFGPAGRGRRHRASNYRRGYLNKWDDTSRIKNAVTAKCDALYCSYYLDVVEDHRSSFGSHTYQTPLRSGIHLDTTDTTTITAWENFVNDIIIASFAPQCKVFAPTDCAGVLYSER